MVNIPDKFFVKVKMLLKYFELLNISVNYLH